MPRLTDVERPQPPQQPGRRVDPAMLAVISGAKAELNSATEEVADVRSRLAGVAVINWFGVAADRHQEKVLERIETLDVATREMAVTKQGMLDLEAGVQLIVAQDDLELRAYEQSLSEYAVAVRNYDEYIFGQ